MALFSHSRHLGANGATFSRLVSILGRQVFLSSLLGLNGQLWLVQSAHIGVFELIAVAVGLAVLLYTLRYGPAELKLFIAFAFAVLALGLARPLAGTSDRLQWDWLCVPGCGNRYYFLPMLAFLGSLLWMASRRASPRALRYFAMAVLLLLPIGICEDWQYRPLPDLNFQKYAERFEHAPSGTKVTIPIYPGLTMELTKR